MSSTATNEDLRVRTRLLQLMAALERAGATPVSNRDLHALAYLANVLSPLWEVEPLETSVLKDRNGPRSSALERELDLCVGLGLLSVVTLRSDPEHPTRLDATYRVNGSVARKVLHEINSLPDEVLIERYLSDLAFAFGEIEPERRDDAALQDAAWSNPAVALGRIVDFGDHAHRNAFNPAINSAEAFQKFAPVGVKLNQAEKMLMYVRLLKRRAHG